VVDSGGSSWPVSESTSKFDVDPLLAADLASAAGELSSQRVARITEHNALDDADLLIGTEVAMRQASPKLLAALVDFRINGSRDGTLLLRGLSVDDPLPLTPETGAFSGSWHELAVSTIVQLMVMSVLGDVISYADEKQGRLIQDICPVPGAEHRQENTGSCLLELHTEDGFHPNKPHFISLFGLRSDHNRQAVTLAAGIRSALPRIGTDHLAELQEPKFRVRLSSSFVGTNSDAYSPPMPILTGNPRDPDLCVDFHATEALTKSASAALESLRRHLLGSLTGATLEPGDLLIIDNRKAVHGRTGFTPRYDGQDRWLRRCFAVADIRASNPLLYPHSRVHVPLTEANVGV
jgi:L-asparagine oxygenase